MGIFVAPSRSKSRQAALEMGFFGETRGRGLCFFSFLPLHFRAKGVMKKPCCLGYIGDETLPSNMRLYRAQMLLLLFVPK